MKDKKTQIRVDPELARALRVAGTLEKKPAYQIAEEAIRDYMAAHYPRLWEWQRKA